MKRFASTFPVQFISNRGGGGGGGTILHTDLLASFPGHPGNVNRSVFLDQTPRLLFISLLVLCGYYSKAVVYFFGKP